MKNFLSLLVNKYKIGDEVTAKTKDEEGNVVFVSGSVTSVTKDRIFLIRKFPVLKHYSIKPEDIISDVD